MNKKTLKRKTFLSNLLQLAFVLFIMFFLTTGLYEISKDIILEMNTQKNHSTWEWVQFIFFATLFSIVWATLWLWFKKTEKICLDYIFQQEKQS